MRLKGKGAGQGEQKVQREKALKQAGAQPVGHEGTEVNWSWGLSLEGGEARALSAHWGLDQNGLLRRLRKLEVEVYPDGSRG